MAGFWIDTHRRTTLPGLYAAGDAAGGAPKKYITGCFAEAQMAVEHFLSDTTGSSRATASEATVNQATARSFTTAYVRLRSGLLRS